jgi:glycosyltransferase involved in cell wall biosynthesis
MEKSKICIVVNDLAIGGLPSVVLSILQEIDSSHFQFYLLNLSDQEGILDQEEIPKSVKYHSIPIDIPDAYSLLDHLKIALIPSYTKAYSKPVIDYLINIKADLVHFHTQPRQLEIAYLAKNRIPDLEIIFNEHTKRFSKGEYNWYQRRILGFVFRRHFRDCTIVAVSESVRNYLSRLVLKNTKTKQLRLIRNRIDLKRFENIEPQFQPPFNVICISRISYLKRQHVLIEAWKKISHPLKGKLTIIGPDETKGKIPQMGKDDPSILFTGSQSRIENYLKESHIAVLPSSKEGLPLALLESMACSLAIVASNIDEHTSILKDGYSALYFELDNSLELANKIVKLMDEPELMIQLGKNARSYAEKEFSMKDWRKEYQDLYQNVLKHG